MLEPGGRIAVNVANLGRRPYRSLAGDVTQILQDLGLLLRGEVVWWKGRAAGGSCAWGTFQRPCNPVLRDVTERIVIASKGRFDRALKPAQRQKLGLPRRPPSRGTSSWRPPPTCGRCRPRAPPGSATRRPSRSSCPSGSSSSTPTRATSCSTRSWARAPPRWPRCAPAGTTSASTPTGLRRPAQRADRRGVSGSACTEASPRPLGAPAAVPSADETEDFQARAVREGRQAKEIAEILLDECGFVDIRSDVKIAGLGIELNFVANDHGDDWAFDVSGAFTSSRAGLKRTDTLWKALGKAAVLHEDRTDLPLVLLTTDARREAAPAKALSAWCEAPGARSSTSSRCSTPTTRRASALRRRGPARPLTCRRTARSSPSWPPVSACSVVTTWRRPSRPPAELANLGADWAGTGSRCCGSRQVRPDFDAASPTVGPSSRRPTPSTAARPGSWSGPALGAHRATRSCPPTSGSTTSTS